MTTTHSSTPTDVTDLAPTDIIPTQALNTPLNEAMNVLLRACATDYLGLPPPVLEAYQDRDHSKFNIVRWQRYLDGLTDAIAHKIGTVRLTCPHVYRAYQGVRLVKAMQKKVQL